MAGIACLSIQWHTASPPTSRDLSISSPDDQRSSTSAISRILHGRWVFLSRSRRSWGCERRFPSAKRLLIYLCWGRLSNPHVAPPAASERSTRPPWVRCHVSISFPRRDALCQNVSSGAALRYGDPPHGGMAPKGTFQGNPGVDLTVDVRSAGRGFGGALLADALLRVRRSEMAAYALVVDAKDDPAVAFYEHHGLIRLPGRRMTLSLPIPSICR